MRLLKNIIYILLLSNVFLLQKISSMYNQNHEGRKAKNPKINVYSHGLGQQGDPSTGPVYDYSGGEIKNSSFYGKHNINIFINYLLQNEQAKSSKTITIEGMSMGAGVVLTALAELCQAADNKQHCIDNITSEEAQALIRKINRGYIILNAPIFNLQDTQIVVFISCLSSFIVRGMFSLFMYYVLTKNDKNHSYFNVFIAVAFMFISEYSIKHLFPNFYVQKIIPWLISENYNPNCSAPNDTEFIIRRKITCPILVHISQNDELLWYTKDSIYGFINRLLGNRHKPYPTVLLLSGDGRHDQNNNDFDHIKQNFIKNSRSYTTYTSISEVNNLHPNSKLDDWTLKEEPVDIKYKEPLFPLISSGIAVAKTIGRLW